VAIAKNERDMVKNELLIKNQLFEDEELLWLGQPRQGFALRNWDLFWVPFHICWFGLLLSSVTEIIIDYGIFQNLLLFAPLFIFGLHMTIGRFFFDSFLRKRTEYALTNSRAIILINVFKPRITEVDILRVNNVSISQIVTGDGTITFGNVSWHPYSYYTRAFLLGTSSLISPQFELITESKKVYQMIVSLREDC